VERFVSRHAGAVIGTLCGFDRLVLRGTLRRLAQRGGMMAYLWAARVLLKDFAAHATALSGQLKAASEELAERSGRPLRYLASSALSKEAVAREIAVQDGVEQGLICILSAVEPCLSYEIVRNRATRRLELQPRQRKCLHFYHYALDPELGFMSARIQTWFPFQIQICLNGREWLARRMNAAKLDYVQRDNCFTWLADVERAQDLMNAQLGAAWPALLDGFARQLNPHHEAMFAAFPVDYYWTVYQSEWASDLMFRNAASLAGLYPKLVHHGMTTFRSADVMRFLGRTIPPSGRLPANLKADVASDLTTRPEGVRIKHRLGANTIKMYDKQGSVLRVETTINDAAAFKSFRTPEGKPAAPRAWHRMRKGIADLHRRTQVSQAANDRYLRALASVEDTTALGKLAAPLCQPATRNGRRVRPLNPYAPGDGALLEAIGRGEFALNGFRNRDLRRLLFADAAASPHQRRRHAAAISRKLALLRAHRLIRKVPGTHRYHLSATGRTVVTALLTARNASTDLITKLAA
jgi:hypothetical protein